MLVTSYSVMDKEIDKCERDVAKTCVPLDKHITWHMPFVFLIIEILMGERDDYRGNRR